LLIEASVEAGRFTGRAIRSDVDLDRQITGRAKLEQTNGRVLPVKDVDLYPCTKITGFTRVMRARSLSSRCGRGVVEPRNTSGRSPQGIAPRGRP